MSRVTLERDAHIVSRTAKYKPIIKYTIVMLVVRLLVIHLLISSSLCLLSFRKGSHFGSNRALHAIRPKEISLEVPDVEKFMEFYQTALKLPKESIDKLRFTNDVVMKLSTWKPTPVAEKFQPEGLWGIGVMRNNVKELIARFPGVARPLGDYFNGASFFPDEEEKTLFPVRYAWLTDPWGMHVEAIEREESAVQHAKVILNVLDLDKTISFYKDLLGLQLFRRRSNINSRPRDASMVARLGADDENRGLVLEFVYRYAVEAIDVSQGLQKIDLVTDDLEAIKRKLAEAAMAFEEGPEGLSVRDPTGYALNISSSPLKDP